MQYCGFFNISYTVTEECTVKGIFVRGVQKFRGSRWLRDPHKIDKVVGCAQLPQLPHIDAGGSGSQDYCTLPHLQLSLSFQYVYYASLASYILFYNFNQILYIINIKDK